MVTMRKTNFENGGPNTLEMPKLLIAETKPEVIEKKKKGSKKAKKDEYV